MRKETPSETHNITLPYHNEIAKGTLSDILSKLALWNSTPKEELIRILKDI
ncbi:MAG: type II toxin-antitoxin system HicA family toxin [Candidatus Thermoplasmatota archaeon]|nr:type II toxin-antitoxin system HicA family toxin [Candidatus Thermoplasmatota archaeon]